MGRIVPRWLLAIILAGSLAACTAGTAVKPGDVGSSFENAVVLEDAKTEMEGDRAEHKWVKTHFPGWSWGTQRLVNHNGKAYDIIEISRGGESREIYFDIGNWFGKLG